MQPSLSKRSWQLLLAALFAALLCVQPAQTQDTTPKKKKKAEAAKAAAEANKAQTPEANPKKKKKADAAKAEPEATKPTPEPVKTTKTEPTAKATTPAVKNAGDLAAKIDLAIEKRLSDAKVPASPLADDAEFLRRVYLDITGVIPSAEKAKAFLDSKEPDKRAKLVDELLANPLYGRHMADIWQDLLLTRTSDNRRLNPTAFIAWLEGRFNENTPWNTLTQQLVTANGTMEENPGVAYFLANNTVDKITDNVAKNLLGLQLQCAQCHNHPFTGWKQEQYWGMAAFFLKVRPDNVNKAAKTGASAGVSEGPAINKNKRTLPESAKLVPARFLQGEEAKLSNSEPFRPALANWMTSSKNPYFAKAMINRVWAQFFGRGLVNPVDDMHDGNLASHPDLLKALADGFVANGYDVKEVIRAVCLSKTYQRTSKPAPGNEDAEPALYSRVAVKVLTAEQLYDSLVSVAGTSRNAEVRPAKNGRVNIGGRQQFVLFFRPDEGADPTEYQAGIPQALRLMNANQFNPAATAATLARNGGKAENIIETLYLTTLSRRPTATEMTRMVEFVKNQSYGDVLWVLVNSSEFALNH